MVSGNLQLFGPLMKYLTTKICATGNDVKQLFTSRLKISDKGYNSEHSGLWYRSMVKP
jgi:hypothetical protein